MVSHQSWGQYSSPEMNLEEGIPEIRHEYGLWEQWESVFLHGLAECIEFPARRVNTDGLSTPVREWIDKRWKIWVEITLKTDASKHHDCVLSVGVFSSTWKIPCSSGCCLQSNTSTFLNKNVFIPMFSPCCIHFAWLLYKKYIFIVFITKGKSTKNIVVARFGPIHPSETMPGNISILCYL